MDVVLRSTCGQQRDFVVFREHGEVAPERFAIGDNIGAVLSAEDAMHQHGSVRVGHRSTVIATWRDER